VKAFLEQPTRMLTWGNGPMDVGELQRKLSRRATAEPQQRFGDLYALLLHRDWLAQAYGHIRTNTGSATPGVDGETRRSFEANVEENLECLGQSPTSSQVSLSHAKDET
jgi:retron-type reverse transcriptase